MRKGFSLAVLLAVTVSVVGAQAPPDDTRPAGPEPGVAHLSYAHGDVSMQRGDSGDWIATSLNTPIVRGDIVATGDRSRAEVQLDYATFLRLAGQSQAKIADLAEKHIQVQVAQGLATVAMSKGSEADVEIDATNVTIHP